MGFDLMNLVQMAGGLALFIYGMTTMGTGLEQAAGAKLEKTLEKMTGNIFSALIMGMVVTAVIQSSSATTVMVVGFVNAGIMTLKQSVGVILGANIGTTITAQILRLDSSGTMGDSFLMQILKPKNFAYIMVLLGIILMMTSKSKRRRNIADILIGLGVLFIGMATMEKAVAPLADLPQFSHLFAAISNPVLGVLVGAAVTAIIQSSSASVGILQALSTTGAIAYSAAIPIILGQNIGTCITAFLSSIGGTKNARRTAMIHLYFNLIGSIVFLTVVYTLQSTIGFSFWGQAIDKAGIANLHTLFNVVVTISFLPFTRALVYLAEHTIHADDEKPDPLAKLEPRLLATPIIALDQAQHCIADMGTAALENYILAVDPLFHHASQKPELFLDHENFMDRAEVEIAKYLVQIRSDLPGGLRRQHAEMLHSLSDFEKIGDYEQNIFDAVTSLQEGNLQFTNEAQAELKIMSDAVRELLEKTVNGYLERSVSIARQVEPIEEVIDMLKVILKNRHIERLNAGRCTIQTGLPFLEIVHDLEKIGDHCSNIAIYTIQLGEGKDGFDTHDFSKHAYKASPEFREAVQYFQQKYLSRLEKNTTTAK